MGQQDMEPDRGGKRNGVNGGRGKRVRRVGEFADPEHRRLVVGGGLERQHKSNKRQQKSALESTNPAGWDSLSPMSQRIFAMNVALPRIAAADGLKPSPWRLARLVPITWDKLGPSFVAAFQAHHQRETSKRQFAIRNDIKV